MDRYYFHQEAGVRMADDLGTELPSLDAAKDMAVQLIVEMLKANSQLFWHTASFRVIVSAPCENRLFAIALGAE